ncbi:hypothetical protein LguiA_013489 [Lonicera macranthoides]
MQVVPRWRITFLIKNSLIQSTASFHSTPTSFEKWKNKWNSDVRRGQQPPSKSYIRYETRQKRADAKKALNDLLFNSGSFNSGPSKFMFEEVNDQADHSDSSDKKGRSKFSAHRASKAHHKRMKRKFRRENPFDDFDEHPGNMFEARFGDRWYTWSFKPREESAFRNSTAGFEWREKPNTNRSSYKEWETSSETDSEVESSRMVGSCSQRTLLGLPAKGPLKIEDVKNAFRLSALKWHPDKHQGPSQAMAEEKFKDCVNAYNSLCNALCSA